MEPKRVWNPPNPYLTEHREWLGEPPIAELEIYEDSSKSILSENTSPDIGFRWSVNPYRGCFHACAYCLLGETPVLLADGRTRALADLQVGDEIYGTVRHGASRQYVRTRVLAHWSTVRSAYRILLEDGTELIASADHRFLTNRGWKYVTGCEQGHARRPHLTANVELMGTGRFAGTRLEDAEYRRGYLSGMIRGDGLLDMYKYDGHRRATDVQHHFRLALIDPEALERTRRYLLDFDVTTQECAFGPSDPRCRPMRAIRTHARGNVECIRKLIEWPGTLSYGWARGFLAGIFDAEGSYSRGILRIANTNLAIIDCTQSSLRMLGFTSVLDLSDGRPVQYVRLRGGLREALRFFHCVDPAIGRKRVLEGQALKSDARLRVMKIAPLGLKLPMFDVTTDTGDFIANGVVSHNCYARPTHEYFGLGAGTDFERKIFIKRRAPQLLEDAFRRRSWRGERVVFSGVTDCYQPLEAAWKLTRGCLEVCLKYRNPVAIITKSLLVRRDIELLKALHATARVTVSVSIAFLDEAVARVMDPGAPTIRKRFETVQLLAEAGLPVSVGVAPVIAGLNDSDIPGLLQEAKRRGASSAFKVLLRLPGSVKPVFFRRLEHELPLKAAKIEHRIREARNGRLTDSRFGNRFHGDGPYWEAINATWSIWTRRLGFDQDEEEGERRPGALSAFRAQDTSPARIFRLGASTFQRPAADEGQQRFAWAPDEVQ